MLRLRSATAATASTTTTALTAATEATTATVSDGTANRSLSEVEGNTLPLFAGFTTETYGAGPRLILHGVHSAGNQKVLVRCVIVDFCCKETLKQVQGDGFSKFQDYGLSELQ